MALAQRKPQGVIHHPDQGSQHTSLAFGQRCAEMRVRPSMGSVGDAYDNAMAESLFATLECELIERRSFRSKVEAKAALFSYIEGWYNPRRRHSALSYHSPVEFERRIVAEPCQATEINEKTKSRLENQADNRPWMRDNFTVQQLATHTKGCVVTEA